MPGTQSAGWELRAKGLFLEWGGNLSPPCFQSPCSHTPISQPLPWTLIRLPRFTDSQLNIGRDQLAAKGHRWYCPRWKLWGALKGDGPTLLCWYRAATLKHHSHRHDNDWAPLLPIWASQISQTAGNSKDTGLQTENSGVFLEWMWTASPTPCTSQSPEATPTSHSFHHYLLSLALRTGAVNSLCQQRAKRLRRPISPLLPGAKLHIMTWF